MDADWFCFEPGCVNCVSNPSAFTAVGSTLVIASVPMLPVEPSASGRSSFSAAGGGSVGVTPVSCLTRSAQDLYTARGVVPMW